MKEQKTAEIKKNDPPKPRQKNVAWMKGFSRRLRAQVQEEEDLFVPSIQRFLRSDLGSALAATSLPAPTRGGREGEDFFGEAFGDLGGCVLQGEVVPPCNDEDHTKTGADRSRQTQVHPEGILAIRSIEVGVKHWSTDKKCLCVFQ